MLPCGTDLNECTYTRRKKTLCAETRLEAKRWLVEHAWLVRTRVLAREHLRRDLTCSGSMEQVDVTPTPGRMPLLSSMPRPSTLVVDGTCSGHRVLVSHTGMWPPQGWWRAGINAQHDICVHAVSVSTPHVACQSSSVYVCRKSAHLALS